MDRFFYRIKGANAVTPADRFRDFGYISVKLAELTTYLVKPCFRCLTVGIERRTRIFSIFQDVDSTDDFRAGCHCLLDNSDITRQAFLFQPVAKIKSDVHPIHSGL